MPDGSSSVTDARRRGGRIVALGIAAIVAILALAAGLLFLNLPDAGAFNDQVAQIFAENDDLTGQAEIRLLEILAASGTAFAGVLQSYRVILFILLVFATALLVAALVLLVAIAQLNRRMAEIERQGLLVTSLVIRRAERVVSLNSLDFTLTEAAIETLSVLAEARLDDDVLTGAEIEAVIQGRDAGDCEEAAGATRIKRLRDALGNQVVAELLVRNIARKGYVLAVDKRALSVE